MINLTAQGSGYYIVSVDGVDTTQHVTEREAIESAVNQEQANPAATVTYRHDYIVRVEEVADTVPAPAPTPEPAPQPTLTPSGDLILFDGFEYVVGRDDPNASNLFMAQGWTGCKTSQSGEPGARGYLYTVNAIPGYVGEFPGGGSRVLCMEALPRTLGAQTDFYLQYGVGADPAYDNTIPADVWIQFWIYINHFGDQLSRITEGKLLYPCAGTYPCQQTKWLMVFDHESKPPLYNVLPNDAGAYLWHDASAQGTPITYPDNYDERWKFGQQDITQFLRMNQWTQVKLHFNTTGPGGVYEQWLRPMYGQWQKVAEYIDGVSPPGFVWKCVPGGNRVLRMPTTIGMNTNDPTLNYDVWMYMDNFAMARTEAALPQY